MVSQNLQIFLKQLLTAVSFSNLKIGGLSKLLNGSLSQTLKKALGKTDPRNLPLCEHAPSQSELNLFCFYRLGI